jgi:hypothetical protein
MGPERFLEWTQKYGEEYARFLASYWGPPPHVCPECATGTIRKLLIGDPARSVGDRIPVKWYIWCESCLRGIYCPPGSYAVRDGTPYIVKGDKAAIESALPAGLKLIEPVKMTVVDAEPD